MTRSTVAGCSRKTASDPEVAPSCPSPRLLRMQALPPPRSTKRRKRLVQHNYYFAGSPTTSANLPQFLCQDAQNAVDDRFPVFVGEWSIEAASNNTLVSRPRNLNTGLKAWAQYTRGSSFWTWKFRGNVPVNGEGTQAKYWN
ncbi:unnamed protein product [Clonostachys rhizophaga]|uniref:Uncharacterized protein n=1 Tax=Clonostachys rhizophaga TaxID=160324 RepID=A0A9N9VH94_9HYPO|nr:unnamed protein product [Clonostachys rhizophaga]